MKTKITFLMLVFLMVTGICFAAGVKEYVPIHDTAIPQQPAKELVKGLDEENPYYPPITGLAHDMNAKGTIYSVYVPQGQYPWAPGVIILTPDGVTAREFAESELGKEWMRAAETHKFSFGIVQPEYGVWNVTGAEDGRDEVEAIINVYTQMRSKSKDLNLPFTMDKSRVTLVGYDEGAAAAIAAASGESAAFAAVAAVNSTGSSKSYLKALDASYCYPFPADGLKAKEEVKLENGTLKMPIWFIGDQDEVALNSYKAKNGTDAITYTPDALRFYNSDEPVASVFVTVDDAPISVDKLWTEFLSQYTRPLGVEGGHLAYAMNFETRADGRGYVLTEEMFDGFLRRYITYVPSCYDPEKESALVMVCHGYTASMYAIAEESRWCDVAEENNIIVVFPQAYPNVLDFMANIPAPAWISPNLFAGGENNTDDIAFLTHVIEETKKNYSINEGRVYGTGHSNGCAMILSLASENPDLFTAIAPIGFASPGTSEATDQMLPTWIFMGEYDGVGFTLEEGGDNDAAVSYWTEFNGLEKDDYIDTVTEDGRFNIRTWKTASGAPLFRFAGVNCSAHSYFPAESELIWNDFFSRYEKRDGVLLYDGTEVNDTALKQIVIPVADNVWCISEFYLVNTFLVEGADKAVLIDTGCGLGNIREVAESLTDKPIEVLLTHGHPDHMGGIYHFAGDTKIYMNELDEDRAFNNPMNNAGREFYVNSRGPVRFPGHEAEMNATIPEYEPDMSFEYTNIEDGDIIDLGGGVELEIIATPGHTDGSVCVLDRDNRILFGGDTLNQSIILGRQPNNDTKLIKILNDTMKKIWSYSDAFDCIAVGHDEITTDKSRVLGYLTLTNGLLDGSLVGEYEEVDFRAGDVVRMENAELWYQCDR